MNEPRNVNDIPLQKRRELWVEALRSGKYGQCQSFLCTIDSDLVSKKYCCLGVACEVFIKNGGQLYIRRNHGTTISYDNENQMLPLKVQDWLGLRTHDGEFTWSYEDSTLVACNDCGSDFNEIADIIEKRPKGLFIDDPTNS